VTNPLSHHLIRVHDSKLECSIVPRAILQIEPLANKVLADDSTKEVVPLAFGNELRIAVRAKLPDRWVAMAVSLFGELGASTRLPDMVPSTSESVRILSKYPTRADPPQVFHHGDAESQVQNSFQDDPGCERDCTRGNRRPIDVRNEGHSGWVL